jgi:hypothetical protein
MSEEKKNKATRPKLLAAPESGKVVAQKSCISLQSSMAEVRVQLSGRCHHGIREKSEVTHKKNAEKRNTKAGNKTKIAEFGWSKYVGTLQRFMTQNCRER